MPHRQPTCLSCTHIQPPLSIGTVFVGCSTKTQFSSRKSALDGQLSGINQLKVIHFSYIVGLFALGKPETTAKRSNFGKTDMNKEKIAADLRQLVADENKRSKAARLRDVFDEVETTLAAGVSRAAVLEVLNKRGLAMSITTFDSTMARLRAQQKKKASPAKPTATPNADDLPAPSNPMQPGTDQAENSPRTNSDPAAIDKIARTTVDLDSLARAAKGK